MAQMWAIGQMPSMDNQQKFGKGNKGKKEGKADGKTSDDSGGKAGGKDMPQQKWVEVQKNNNNNAGKGQNRGMRQDQWQPTLGFFMPFQSFSELLHFINSTDSFRAVCHPTLSVFGVFTYRVFGRLSLRVGMWSPVFASTEHA